ncbi:hypothetical protein [Corallococcus silvisoli]|uniref:hypothetical protein n=1 Tax=Corallococcus silvisoli TaxID=2697031 RepID=UPI001378BBE1|nr:hypothetical protein [Corallococcus silvisoli]NBD08799.1 hypothetical protein [Corallococcus silvisoli]
MKKILIGVAAMASLTACGNSVCENLKDGFNKANTQSRACGAVPDDPDYTLEFTDEQMERCEKGMMDSCSDDDKKKLDALADCMKAVPACKSASAEELDAMGLKYDNCLFDNLMGLSEACINGRAG